MFPSDEPVAVACAGAAIFPPDHPFLRWRGFARLGAQPSRRADDRVCHPKTYDLRPMTFFSRQETSMRSNMTRRGFLKALGLGAAAVAAGPALGRAALPGAGTGGKANGSSAW